MVYVVRREDQNQRCQEQPTPDLELECLAVRVEFDEPLQALLDAVGRASGELEGWSPRADRISQQLTEALAIFHRETGRA